MNVIDGGKIDEAEMEEETLALDDEKLTVNVNTTEDLKIAERLL
ncbi:MAG: hypothetical protein ACE5Z5_03770 [Candidatus Bathyarchaeia archaeon]